MSIAQRELTIQPTLGTACWLRLLTVPQRVWLMCSRMSLPLGHAAQRVFALLAVALVWLGPATAEAARLALLIGNDNYEHVTKLRNARADALTMADALRAVGYFVEVRTDRTQREMLDDIRSFRQRVQGGDEVIFFFSGHGVQIAATNHLLPINVRNQSEEQVRDDGLELSRVLADLRAARPAFTLAIIDACRDNPFAGAGRAIGGRGLTGVAGASGQMVIYAAGEGQQALDRVGTDDTTRNGLFTRVFVQEVRNSTLPVHQILRHVRVEVSRLAQSVGHMQVPAIYDQVLGDFYFRTVPQATQASATASSPGSGTAIAAVPSGSSPASAGTSAPSAQVAALAPNLAASAGPRQLVRLATSEGDIVLELDRDKAPKTVDNFLGYVKSGHYDGTVFHRVIPTFMIQGGGMKPDMSEKKTLAPIPLESRNGLSNARGAVAMARTMDPNSATAQFFINVVDNAFLDQPNARDGNGYAVFGKVMAGMEVVDKIKLVPTQNAGPHQNVPVKPVVIRKATLEK